MDRRDLFGSNASLQSVGRPVPRMAAWGSETNLMAAPAHNSLMRGNTQEPYGVIGKRKSKGSKSSLDSRPRGSGTVDTYSRLAPWFLAGLSREHVKKIVLQMMKRKKPGSFIVRDVQSEDDAFALAVIQKDGSLGNFLIENCRDGWNLRGTSQAFVKLSELILYYTQALRQSLGIRLVEMHDLRDGIYNDEDPSEFAEPYEESDYGTDDGRGARREGRPGRSRYDYGMDEYPMRRQGKETHPNKGRVQRPSPPTMFDYLERTGGRASYGYGDDELAVDDDGLPVSRSHAGARGGRMQRRVGFQPDPWIADQRPAHDQSSYGLPYQQGYQSPPPFQNPGYPQPMRLGGPMGSPYDPPQAAQDPNLHFLQEQVESLKLEAENINQKLRDTETAVIAAQMNYSASPPPFGPGAAGFQVPSYQATSPYQQGFQPIGAGYAGSRPSSPSKFGPAATSPPAPWLNRGNVLSPTPANQPAYGAGRSQFNSPGSDFPIPLKSPTSIVSQAKKTWQPPASTANQQKPQMPLRSALKATGRFDQLVGVTGHSDWDRQEREEMQRRKVFDEDMEQRLREAKTLPFAQQKDKLTRLNNETQQEQLRRRKFDQAIAQARGINPSFQHARTDVEIQASLMILAEQERLAEAQRQAAEVEKLISGQQTGKVKMLATVLTQQTNQQSQPSAPHFMTWKRNLKTTGGAT